MPINALFGILMIPLGLLGLFAASRATDTGFQLFGFLLFGFAVFFCFWLMRRHFDGPSI